MLWVRVIFLGLWVVAGPSAAQTPTDPAQADQPKITALDPPRSDVADQYRAQAAGQGLQTDVTYAATLDGTLRSDGSFVPPKKRAAPTNYTAPSLSGTAGIVLVMVVLLAGLALWLRFGGAGGLLAKGPGDIAPKPVAPQGWAMPQPQDVVSGGDIFATIHAMADRRAAMVLLLRTSLMQAATTSGTRFARSDTERDALRRLPQTMMGQSILRDLLQQAELAHYGGREVSQDLLNTCIDRARTLFGPSGARA